MPEAIAGALAGLTADREVPPMTPVSIRPTTPSRKQPEAPLRQAITAGDCRWPGA
jgi:hypothetical protein